jgi:hypothetical protein
MPVFVRGSIKRLPFLRLHLWSGGKASDHGGTSVTVNEENVDCGPDPDWVCVVASEPIIVDDSPMDATRLPVSEAWFVVDTSGTATSIPGVAGLTPFRKTARGSRDKQRGPSREGPHPLQRSEGSIVVSRSLIGLLILVFGIRGRICGG